MCCILWPMKSDLNLRKRSHQTVKVPDVAFCSLAPRHLEPWNQIHIWILELISYVNSCIVLLSFAFSCLKAFWRSFCSVWILSLRLIPLIVFQLEGFSNSLSCWRADSADLDTNDVHHLFTRPSMSSLLCCAHCAAPNVCSCSSAAW